MTYLFPWPQISSDNLPTNRWGSENANGVFLALVELLVIKGLARNIKVSRLKVGHTHEDIDGVFGVLWEGTVCVLLS